MAPIIRLIIMVLLLLELLTGVAGGYRRRKYGRKYRLRPRQRHHKHHHRYEYYEPTYEKVHETRYEPHYDEDVIYEDELDYDEGERVVFNTGSRFGGLDLAAALGLQGVGYVANSGGALHVVGRR